MLQLFDRIEADAALRVLVLTGTGRAFSAGYDLNSVAERAASAVEQQSAGSAFEVVVNRLEDLGVPTICRLNGGVYGGSTDLALACDFRIGTDSCEMFMPAARLGLHYYKSGIARYVSRLGVDNAKKLFLTAEKIDAAEMLRIGYLTAMVPAEALDQEVDRLAGILAGNAPVAMRGMKRRSTNSPAAGSIEEAADRRAPRQHARRRDQGRHQGVRRKTAAEVLMASRSPNFSGRHPKSAHLRASRRMTARRRDRGHPSRRGSRGCSSDEGRPEATVLLLHETSRLSGDAGARGAVAVDLVVVVGEAERNAAHHAAVVAELEMTADQAGMTRQRRLRNGAETRAPARPA